MPIRPLTGLDLGLAWQRMKLDRPDRCFTLHPRLIEWVEHEPNSWLRSVEAKLTVGYAPRDSALCWAPKAGGLARPGRVLDLADELVYNALLTAAYPRVWEALRHCQGDPSVANQLQDPSRRAWVRRGARVRTEWRTRSRAKIDATHCSWVVFVDIAGFYDNIDLRLLQNSLARVGVGEDVVNAMLQCLRRWSQPKHRGIPQGYTASDILAGLYLATFDEELTQRGITFLRYVDDVRIFCQSQGEARALLALVSKLLYERSLTPQAGKTAIEPLDAALRRIDGVSSVIEEVHGRLQDDLLATYGEVGPYGTIRELRELAAAHPDTPPPTVLEETFHECLAHVNTVPFDSTLFHYLLNRLGAARSRVAVKYCIRTLRDRPEETESVLRYLSDVGVGNHERAAILAYAGSEDAVYDYQLYQIGRWFYEKAEATEELLRLCRIWVTDRNRAPWLRSYSVFTLGQHGSAADLEWLETSYSSATTELERAEIVAAVARMPTVRRNSFYSAVRDDAQLVRCAVRVAQLEN